MTIKIKGAGLSGLSAAINLAKEGKDVIIHEKNDDVGKHLSPNFQALRCDRQTSKEYLKNLGLEPKFTSLLLKKALFITRKRDIDINLSNPVEFVCRGGKNSIEYGLFRQAKKLGVQFKFNSIVDDKDVDIVAGGIKRSDIIAYGETFENNSFEKDKFVMMYDDKYSPKCWYFYITPHLEGIEAINTVSKPYGKMVKQGFEKAIKEKQVIKEIIGDSKPLETISGVGGVEIRKSWKDDKILFTGEAAGFQDICYGFGMTTALESGKLAAESILYGKDYDKLVKKKILPWVKYHMTKRFITSIAGDRAVEFLFRNTKSGDTVDVFKLNPKPNPILTATLFHLEMIKFKLTGLW